MRLILTILVCFCSLLLAEAANGFAADLSEKQETLPWQSLEPGLQLARVTVETIPPPGEALVTPSLSVPVSILRIDPQQFDFSLYMASERGIKPLAEVAKTEDFAAAINAGMYLPDKMTNTGYMRNGTHTNNAKISSNFGAFFVAGSKAPPRAFLFDKTKHDWEKTLTRYDIVMQNYRMNTPEGRVIWKQAERLHSVAALSQDASGAVLFILCPQPVQAADFVAALLRLPLHIETVMYLEGGSEAALLIRAGNQDTVETGQHVINLWGGNGGNLLLPNVLGIRRRK